MSSLAEAAAPATPIPGLGHWESLRRFAEFRAHPPRFFQGLTRRFGDVSAFWVGPERIVFVNDPALVTQVLQRTEDTFHKDKITLALSEFLGLGLLTSEGSLWRKQRKLLAPPLSRNHIALYAEAMARRTDAWLKTVPDRSVRDVHHDMTDVTLAIVVDTLFGDELPEGSEGVGHAVDDVMTAFEQVARSFRRFLPPWFPSAPRRRMRAAVQLIDRCVYSIIADKRRKGASGDDIISRMLLARDDEGEAMDDRQLRDEAVTMFVAGHETTANTLVWTLYLLAEDAQVFDKVRAEVRSVLGTRSATADDVAKLPYTEAVLKESMRLYPPAYLLGREAREPLRLGAHAVARGQMVLASPWVLHRDARYFDEPERFRPERWLDGLAERLPKHAYFPFGGGPRVCIGNHFAMMEATIVLAHIVRELRPELASSAEIPLQFAVTLRPRAGLSLRMTRDGA